METNNAQRRMVELTKSFDQVWKSLCGKSVELGTCAGTPFLAKEKWRGEEVL